MTWIRGRAKHRCSECYQLVEGDDVQEYQNRFWQPDAHKAPCGAACAGGLLTPDDRRAGVHRNDDGPTYCPGCSRRLSDAWALAKRDAAARGA